MARIDAEALAEPERVFIAETLAEARRVEELLSGDGVDYVVKVEAFVKSVLFGARNGAAFYVVSGQAAYCRSRLTAAGLGQGVLEEPE